MIQIVTGVLLQFRLEWKPSSLAYLAPGCDEDEVRPDLCVVINHPSGSVGPPGEGLRIPHAACSLQLGTLLHYRGCSWEDVNRRIDRAHAAFWADKTLRSKLLHRAERLRRYSESVASVLCFGCEAWAMTVAMLQKLSRAEGGMLRHVAKPRRRHAGEDLAHYMRICTQSARRAYTKLGHHTVTERILARRHRFAQLLVRGPLDGEPSEASAFLQDSIDFRTEAGWRCCRVQQLELRR